MNNTTLPINRAHTSPVAADVHPRSLNQQEISPDSRRRRRPQANWLTLLAAASLLLSSANLVQAATFNGGAFGGVGPFSGWVYANDTSTVTINGGTFGGLGNKSGLVVLWRSSTVTFRAAHFDETSYSPATGGTLGVTFCSQSPLFISVLVFGGTVVQEHVSCVIDTDGDSVPDDEDECPNSLDVGSTIKIGGTDTGVPNVGFENGCTISDMIADLADGAKNHGQFVRHIAALKNALRKEGILTAEVAEALQSAAAQSSLP